MEMFVDAVVATPYCCKGVRFHVTKKEGFVAHRTFHRLFLFQGVLSVCRDVL